jgi:hypothetical protein
MSETLRNIASEWALKEELVITVYANVRLILMTENEQYGTQ